MQPELTVCMLHWKRPKQMAAVLDALATQEPRPVIFLWNNSGQVFHHSAVDWQVDSSRNAQCLPRVWMAGWAETPFVCLHDDDLLPYDEHVLHDLVVAASRLKADQAAGPCGAILPPDRPYLPHKSVWCPGSTTPVDLVKGRCLVARTEILRERLSLADVTAEDGIADDFVVCGRLAGGKRLYHVVPAGLTGRYRNLPVGREASFASPDHARRRNAAFRKWLCHANA